MSEVKRFQSSQTVATTTWVDAKDYDDLAADCKAISEALLFMVKRCEEQGFYSPSRQKLVHEAIPKARERASERVSDSATPRESAESENDVG